MATRQVRPSGFLRPNGTSPRRRRAWELVVRAEPVYGRASARQVALHRLDLGGQAVGDARPDIGLQYQGDAAGAGLDGGDGALDDVRPQALNSVRAGDTPFPARRRSAAST